MKKKKGEIVKLSECLSAIEVDALAVMEKAEKKKKSKKKKGV